VQCLPTCSVGRSAERHNARYSGLATAACHQTVSVKAWCLRHSSDTGLHGFREIQNWYTVNCLLAFLSVCLPASTTVGTTGRFSLEFDIMVRKNNMIIKRIIEAKVMFNNKHQLLCSNNLSLEIKKELIKSCIWSVALYGSETWKSS
jgi:hypothetical protein